MADSGALGGVTGHPHPLGSHLRVPYALVFLFLVLASAISLVAWRFHSTQKAALKREVHNQLVTIADFRVRQLAEWRAHQFGHARNILSDSMTLDGLRRYVRGQRSEPARAALLRWMSSMIRESGYAGVTLTDVRGDVLVTAGRTFGDAGHLRSRAMEVMGQRAIIIRDFHSGTDGSIHLGLNFPLRDDTDSAPFGTLLFGIDPATYLYPALQRWPVPTRSAETLLVRRDGDRVTFLNALRHRPDAALLFSFPLTERMLLAVRAVLGTEGALDGIDYRDVPVFGALRRIPDSDWFVVAKIDADEVLAPLRRTSWVMGFMALLLIVAAAVCVMLLWRRQHYRAEIERRALSGHYDYLARYANDVILLTNAEGRIIEANDRAINTYGYTRDELLTMRVPDLRHPDERASFDRQYREVTTAGSLVFETRHIRKDGSSFPVEASIRRIDIGGESFRQSIIRDISERKAMMEELRRTADTMRAVIDASPAAIVTFSPDLTVNTWNRTAERIFGWTAAEMVGRALPPAEFAGPLELFARALAGASYTARPSAAKSRDGREIGLSISTALVHGPDGGNGSLVVSILDITQEREAQQALAASELRFRATFEQAAVGMNHVSLEGRFLRVNRRYCEITGYSEEELIGRRWLDITHPEDRIENHERNGRLLDGSMVTYSSPKRYIRKDGSVIWAYLTLSVLRDPDGRPLHWVSVVEDITERRRMEQALRESEERFRILVEHAPDGILVIANGRFRYLNLAALQMLGASSPAQLLDLAPAELIHPDQRSSFSERMAALSANQPVPPVERTLLRLDRAELPAEVSAVPIEWDREPAALVFFRDIAARKRTEAERARLEQQLLQAQKMESIGRLAGGVSHDFNNLLTVINGYSEMLLQRCPPESPDREELEEIRTAGERAAALTQQLLAFSRKQIAEPKPVNLNEVVEEDCKMLRRLIGEQIRIVTRLDPGIGLVMADRGHMHQILMNLTVNARDAMPHGGAITIATGRVEIGEGDAVPAEARPGRYVVLSVEDTGVGMDSATQDKIFDPFFTTKPKGTGTGLGLSTVYGIVRQSNGWIRVSSRPDEGTTFRIYLPVTESAVALPAGESATQTLQGGHETVLVVEDQPDVRRFAVGVLEKAGYCVLEAPNGADALSLSGRFADPIHLLISDVVMPGMAGTELARRLRLSRPGMQVLFISGYTAGAISLGEVTGGNLALLAKPFTPAELCGKVRAALSAAAPRPAVLVIDDDDAVRGLLCHYLRRAGYEVLDAADGRSGVRLVDRNRVDLVITDIVMPEQEGLETLQLLHQRNAGLPLIAISGAFDGAFLRAAALLGAQATIRKPVRAEEMLGAVERLIGRADGAPSAPMFEVRP